MRSNLIPLAGVLAAGYLVWLATWLRPRLPLRTVPLRRRSLKAISGYPAGLVEGERNGGQRHA